MRKINKLTDAAIRAAKPQDSPYKLMDGTGLYLFITPSGTKSWRYNFHLGSHQTYTYGTYPEMSLDEARKRHLIAKQQVRDGINPSEERQAKMQEVFRQKRENEFTVEVLAKEWLDVTHSQSSEKYRSTLLGRINNHILPSIGNTPVTKVEFDDLKAILRNLEQKQAFPQAKRVCQVLSCIFEYAKYLKVTDRNIAEGLNKIRKKPVSGEVNELPAITDKQGVADMLRKIWNRTGSGQVSPYMATAMKLFCYLPQRSQEIMKGTWDEIDFENAVWSLSKERMKTKKEHDIPLSKQALSLLTELSNYRTSSKFLFPSGNRHGHLLGESVNKNMHTSGIPMGRMTLHGWRKVFSTLAYEAGCPASLVEKTLAHISGDRVANIYNKAEYMKARRILLQWYADYLDALREGSELPTLNLDRASMFG